MMMENEADARLRHKVSKCHIHLKDFTSALCELEKVPQKFRNAKINMALGIMENLTSIYVSFKIL